MAIGSISALDAASAYGKALGIGRGGAAGGLAGTVGKPAGGGFGGMVESLVGNAASSMRAAETASAKQVAGQGRPD